MGSGSSKTKPNKSEPRPDKVSKVQSREIQSVTKKSEQNLDKNLKTQNVIEIEKVKNDKNVQQSSERTTEIKPKSNGNVNKLQPNEKLQSFESDSGSEAEDIDAVLAATRAEHSYRQQQTFNRPTEYYPETYAQRLQREQYEKGQQGLMRQKTIYRNPDEWDMNENREEFDVGKFKEANIAKPPPNPVNRDIYSPPDVTPQTGYQGKTDRYSNQNNSQKTGNSNLPRYDTSEEALLAEIEQEYEL